MRARLLFCRTFILFLGLSTPKAFPAFIADNSDSFSTANEEAEQQGQVTPDENFPLTEAPAATEVPRSEQLSAQDVQKWRETRKKILGDFGNRISGEFRVQDGLRERTEFWFDIYTRYGDAHHIVHHALYPWIVYRIVDTTEMLRNGNGPTWLRHDRANKLATKELRTVRAALVSLARRKNYDNLPPLERELYDKLMPVTGTRKKVFREAALNVRSQLGQKDFFQRGLVNSSRYLPYMEYEFNRLGLPTELTRIPFVESSFNEDARSKVGASGIWQIMPRTGRAYMMVTDQIDERNSPLKATYVAGKLLHSYNHALGSWPLTITAYNHGIGNIQKAVRRTRTRDLVEIISRYHQGDFKFASANYYTCFLAALYAEKYNELIFKDIPREPLQEHEVIKLSGNTAVKYLQRRTGLDKKELLKYNLDLKSALRAGVALPRGFQLHLPPGYKVRLLRQVGEQDKPSKTRT
jgi:membrane-bound lytic murein transglycosylase D